MGTYDTFKTDPDLEENGAWVSFSDGSKWKLRRLTSEAGREAYNKSQRPFTGVIRAANARGKLVPLVLDRQIVRGAMLNGLVVDWEDVTDESGVKLPFNKINLERILKDLPECQNEAWMGCQELANYRIEEMAEAAKNLQAG